MNDGLFQSELAAVIQPRVLVKPESWLSKIEFINHLILFNNVLITILSDKVGGKTSFSNLLQDNLDPQIKLLSIKARAPSCREDIIDDIATQFHLKHDAHTDVSSLVAQINERRSHVLLIIDDAQHLPETFIKEVMLAIKNQEHFSFFHLCLISDHSIVAALNGLTSSFFENLVHHIEVGALNESEARTYVLQRAMAARLITKPLTDLQLKQFYQLTKGNVAKINSHLETFIFNCSTKKKSSVMDVVKKIGIPVGAAVFSGLSCLFIAKSFYIEPVTGPVNEAKAIQQEAALEKKQPPVLLSQIASWQDASTRELVEHSLAAKQDLDLINKGLTGNVVAIVDKAVMQAAKSSRATATKQQTLAKQESLYTIQLVASPYKIDMDRYKKINKALDGSLKLNHYRENKEVWYVLTLGEFSNMSDAQQRINQLPPTVMKLNPWVRPISSLG